MNSTSLALLTIPVAYLIGAIPFGYLTALWARGVDIRTVGSGNIGATNVGRVLGFRFFVIVFLLDLAKGFLPTYLFPLAVARATGQTVPQLGVFVALATIMGHNFPIYLKFKGGKGVATSLGALLALNWVASLAAFAGFVLTLVVTRYVSFSSMLGGLVFLAVYFVRVDDPWNQEHLAMSVVTIGLFSLLVVRHRKNIVRIKEGTEPKVSFRKNRPSGRVAWVLIPILALIAVAAIYGLAAQANRRSELQLRPYDLTEVERVGTGHQRTERLAYADGGKLLAVTCPRYNRVVLYRVTETEQLEVARDIELEGKPVAVWTTQDRLYVLVRPSGDERHVKPGWWQAFDLQGEPIGTRVTAGMYPDDLIVTPDGRHALVLSSGRGEGDPKRPAPALEIFDLDATPAQVVGRLEFDQPGDDPARIKLSARGNHAAVTLLGSNQMAAVDLANWEKPVLISRSSLQKSEAPHLSETDDDSILTAITPDRDAVVIPWPKTVAERGGCLACILPGSTGLTLIDAATRRLLGHFPLRAGSLNLGVARPMGLAFSPERGLLAVATRSGSVHLIAVRNRLKNINKHEQVAVSGPENRR
ncbi:glycerol-3-phosphate 1-O-acyltransferase PlsY [Singulisphaera acidiphila]|uniref:Glycerol-3-phosphate acyltransferase n=1 Tax=Singulisphaera acidiphila (strain ATCC BAA-1392 / DSM 18658 / VKM B-2454 / MOB10) TaxID=886293 RepID=L0DEW5_SINAD|nr:glycerol-3-phosphate 1-O-acyltransferase PlsY [Singulisphaera acidiphila]AGA27380.1 acyl-phosphate glycerol 3-phosphate acyltransferase [Singulisphaera acidiphila DSM 18658]